MAPKKACSRKGSIVRRRAKQHLGSVLLERFEERIDTGWEDLERFDRIDTFQKPVMSFGFMGSKKVILELDRILKTSGYAYWIYTRSKKKVRELSKMGSSSVYVYVSRFPNLIKFISRHDGDIPHDLWGLIFGYPLTEVYRYTYENDLWRAEQFGNEREP